MNEVLCLEEESVCERIVLNNNNSRKGLSLGM